MRIFSQCSLRFLIIARMECLIWPQPELEAKQPQKGTVWKAANARAISTPNSSCGVWHSLRENLEEIWYVKPNKKEDWEVIWTSLVKEDITSVFYLIQKLVKVWFYLTLQPIQLYVSQVCSVFTHICTPVHLSFPGASTSCCFRHFWHH